jgi:hypothetical protein
LATLALLAVSACAQVNAIVMKQPDATRLTGDWEGTYICDQGLMGATLSMTGTPNGQVTAVLDFHAVPENPQIPNGRYTMRGAFTVEGDLRLAPETWVIQPRGFRMVGLNGQVDILNIAFKGNVPQCRKPFKLSKVRSEPTIAAQPPQVPPTQPPPVPVAQPLPVPSAPKPAATPPGPAGETTAGPAVGRRDVGAQTAQSPKTTQAPAAPRTETKTDRLPPSDPDLAREFKARKLIFGHAITPQDQENAKLPEPSQGKPGEIEAALAKYDLNGDGIPDYVKWQNTVGPRGEEDASYEVLLSTSSGYVEAMRFESTRAGMELAAIDVDQGSSNGAHDLVAFANFGDTQGVLFLHFAFDGQRYGVAHVTRLFGGKMSPKFALQPVDKESFAKGSIGGESFFQVEPNPGSRSAGSVVKGTPLWVVGEAAGGKAWFVGARNGYAGFMPKEQIVAKNPLPKGAAKAKGGPKSKASTTATGKTVTSPLCREGERTYLRCKLNGRSDEAAFCGSSEPVGAEAWVTFRFGTRGSVRAEYPARGVPPRAAFYWYAGESTATGPYHDVWFKHEKQIIRLRWYAEGDVIQGEPEFSIDSLGAQTGQSIEGSCEGTGVDSKLFPTTRREWTSF